MPSQQDPQQYHLVHITDQELIHFTRQQNSQSWKGALLEQHYVIRELVLGKSKIASSPVNRLLVFMLKDSNDVPVSSIELLIRESWKFAYENGQVIKKLVLSGCVGGVFTYPEHRGKGVARIMVDKLVTLAKKDLLGPDGFTFLYSEVGEYYTKNGFTSFGIDLLHTPLVKQPSNERYELIEYHQFGEYLSVYSDQHEKEIESKVSEDHKSRVALVPTSDVIDWFHLRSKYISYRLFYEEKDPAPLDFLDANYEQIVDKFANINPRHFGLKIVENGKWIGAIIWTYEFAEKENYATVLKIIVNDGFDKDAVSIRLINSIHDHLHTAPENNLTVSKVVVWESEISKNVKSYLVDSLNSKHGIDNGSRSAILVNNPDCQEKLVKGDLIWEGNNKLPWF